ncbi:MAG: methyltransferase domain-containing protein [Betaproteobacteria bacterium]|nr:methyltransferase domain-containing protein [Betaproteobacteria bacterium]
MGTSQRQNDIVVAAWNTILFDKFRRFKHLLIDGLAPHSNEALARDVPGRPRRGCGFGSTRLIARHVGPRGEAVGVDCAENFIKSAAEEARQAGIANASFFVADVRGRPAGPSATFSTSADHVLDGARRACARHAGRTGGELW